MRVRLTSRGTFAKPCPILAAHNKRIQQQAFQASRQRWSQSEEEEDRQPDPEPEAKIEEPSKPKGPQRAVTAEQIRQAIDQILADGRQPTQVEVCRRLNVSRAYLGVRADLRAVYCRHLDLANDGSGSFTWGRIQSHLQKGGIWTIREVATQTGCSYGWARKNLLEMLGKGLIEVARTKGHMKYYRWRFSHD